MGGARITPTTPEGTLLRCTSMSLVHRLQRFLTQLISETNGLSLDDTLALACAAPHVDRDAEVGHALREFRELLGRFRVNALPIEALLTHPVARGLEQFFLAFPIPFHDEHIHLSGSLDADFVWSRLAPLLDGPDRELYQKKIAEVYGDDAANLGSASDVDRL